MPFKFAKKINHLICATFFLLSIIQYSYGQEKNHPTVANKITNNELKKIYKEAESETLKSSNYSGKILEISVTGEVYSVSKSTNITDSNEGEFYKESAPNGIIIYKNINTNLSGTAAPVYFRCDKVDFLKNIAKGKKHILTAILKPPILLHEEDGRDYPVRTWILASCSLK